MAPERFRQGMTFDEYVAYTGTPENLGREAGWWLGPPRVDFSGPLTFQSVPLAAFFTRDFRYLSD